MKHTDFSALLATLPAPQPRPARPVRDDLSLAREAAQADPELDALWRNLFDDSRV